MNEIYVLNVPNKIDEDHKEALCALVSPHRRDKINRLLHEEGRALSLWSALLVRGAACKFLNVPNSQLLFARGPHGKPYISGFDGLYFGMSHTQGAAAAVFSREEVGIDIEFMRRVKGNISRRFAAGESAYINAAAAGEDSRRFLEIWTKKEAYIKQRGDGIFSKPLSAFDVTDSSVSRFIKTFWQEDYVLSVCAAQPNQSFKITTLCLPEINADMLRGSADDTAQRLFDAMGL